MPKPSLKFPLLKNSRISCSGLETDEKEDLFERIKQIGGSVSYNLVTSVTHLVMKSSLNSSKYTAATKVGIPVVTSNFITECEWEAEKRHKRQRRSQISDSSDIDDESVSEVIRQITERNKLPPFAGCRVCVTGFQSEQRDEIRRIVTTSVEKGDNLYEKYMQGLYKTSPSLPNKIGGGGSYHTELTRTCTHLVAFKPNGQKYTFAKKWGLSIVSIDWLIKSAQTGVRQNEAKFKVESIGNSPQGTKARSHSTSKERCMSTLSNSDTDKHTSISTKSGNTTINRNTSLGSVTDPSSILAQEPTKHLSVTSSATDPPVPQTRTSMISVPDNEFSIYDQNEFSEPFERNCTAANSVREDSVELPPGLTGPLNIDDDLVSNNWPTPQQDKSIIKQGVQNHKNKCKLEHNTSESRAELFLSSCRIALSDASLSDARRKEWRTKISEVGGIWIAEGALARYIRNSAAHSTQDSGNRSAFCTHFVVDDSDELCDEDRMILCALGEANANSSQLANSGYESAQHTGDSPSVLHFERPHIVQCGWLRACWKENSRVNENPYLIPWPVAESHTNHIDDSDSSCKAILGDNHQPQISISNAKTVAAISTETSLPPQPKIPLRTWTAAQSFRPTSSTAAISRRIKRPSASAGSLVGKQMGTGFNINDEDDPFTIHDNEIRERKSGKHLFGDSSSDSGSGGANRFAKRKRPKISLHQDVTSRQLSAPEKPSVEKAEVEDKAMIVDDPQVVLESSSPLQFEFSMLTNRPSFCRAESMRSEVGDDVIHHERNQPVNRDGHGTDCEEERMAILKGKEGENSSTIATASDLHKDVEVITSVVEEKKVKMEMHELFAGCGVTALGFKEKYEKIIERVFKKHGGTYVDLKTCLPVSFVSIPAEQALKKEAPLKAALGALICLLENPVITEIYVIVELKGIDELQWCEKAIQGYSSQIHIVTECWLEQCLQDGVRYPDYTTLCAAGPFSHPKLSVGQQILFRPIIHKRIEGSDGLQLSISGYEGIERDNIGKLAAAVGIAYSERFSKKTTHLICCPPFKGPKYDRAVKWGTIVVDATWLYNTVANGLVIENPEPTSVIRTTADPVQDSHNVSTVAAGTVEAITEISAKTPSKKEHVVQAPVSDAKRSSGMQQSGTKDRIQSINKNQRMETPINKRNAELQFPNTPGLTPMDIALERNIQHALQGGANRAAGTRTGNADDEETQMSPNAKADHRNSRTGLVDSICAEDSNAALTEIKLDILNGVVLALTTRLYHRRGELTSLAMQLGARVVTRFDPRQVTHLVHQSSRERESFKDFRTAQNHGIWIVSPWWLHVCREHKERVSESEFPHTYHPERRLNLVSSLPANSPPPAHQQRPRQQRYMRALQLSPSAPMRTMKGIGSRLQGPGAGGAGSNQPTLVAQMTSGVYNEASSSGRGAKEQILPDATITIDALFGIKSARAKRKYRQEKSSVSEAPSSKAFSGRADMNSHGFGASNGRLAVDGALAQGGIQAMQKAEKAPANVDGDGKDAEDGSPPIKTQDKWWLENGQNIDKNSTIFSTERQRLGSQDEFRLGSNAGLNSLLRAAESPDPHALDQDNTSMAGSVGVNRELASPLAIQRTKILYEEDPEAISERDRLLQKLIGK